MRIESWLRTYSGININPLKAMPDEINIADIAHALSNICRFAGHTVEFYSVAQHSVIVSKVLETQGYTPAEQLQALLHDATEAYMVDVPKPLKVQGFMDGYREFEDELELIIAQAFGFEKLNSPAVKEADRIALATEARDLMGDPQDWTTTKDVRRLQNVITPLLPMDARNLFLARFNELGEQIWKDGFAPPNFEIQKLP